MNIFNCLNHFRHTRDGLRTLLLATASWVALGAVACSDGAGDSRQPASDSKAASQLFRAAMDNPDYLGGALLASQALLGASEADLDDLKQVFDDRDPVPRYHDRALFAIWWAGFDPEAAGDWASKFENGVDYRIRTAILRLWARKDPAAAARRVESMAGETSQRLENFSAVAAGWYESGLPGLEGFLESAQGRGFEQNAIVEVIELIQTTQGSQAAIDWAETIPVGPRTRLTAFRKTAVVLGQNDPEAATRFVEKHMDGSHRSNLIRLVAGRWAARDAPAALDWLRSLPPSGERDLGTEDAFTSWNRASSVEAMAWLDQEPPAAWLDPAFMVRAFLAGYDDPKAGIAMAREIATPEFQHKALVKIVQLWRFRDDATARGWIDAQTDLPDSVLKQMSAPTGGTRRNRPRPDSPGAE